MYASCQMDATGTVFSGFVYRLKFTDIEPIFSAAPAGAIHGTCVCRGSGCGSILSDLIIVQSTHLLTCHVDWLSTACWCHCPLKISLISISYNSNAGLLLIMKKENFCVRELKKNCWFQMSSRARDISSLFWNRRPLSLEPVDMITQFEMNYAISVWREVNNKSQSSEIVAFSFCPILS